MGIIGLILGIVGLLTALVGAIWPIGNLITIIGLILAAAGVVLSALDIKKRQKHGKAVAGLVLSIIAIVIGAVMLIACSGTKSAINNAVTDITSNYSAEQLSSLTEEEQQSLADEIVNDIAFDLGN